MLRSLNVCLFVVCMFCFILTLSNIFLRKPPSALIPRQVRTDGHRAAKLRGQRKGRDCPGNLHAHRRHCESGAGLAGSGRRRGRGGDTPSLELLGLHMLRDLSFALPGRRKGE